MHAGRAVAVHPGHGARATNVSIRVQAEGQNGAVSDSSLAAGYAALEAGRWAEARAAFESALAAGESPDACLGLATALWWLGDNHASVAHASRAYALFRQAANVERAVQCAVWLGITYKANFANFAAANGWIGRAERLLEPLEPGPLHGWVARRTRLPDARPRCRRSADRPGRRARPRRR